MGDYKCNRSQLFILFTNTAGAFLTRKHDNNQHLGGQTNRVSFANESTGYTLSARSTDAKHLLAYWSQPVATTAAGAGDVTLVATGTAVTTGTTAGEGECGGGGDGAGAGAGAGTDTLVTTGTAVTTGMTAVEGEGGAGTGAGTGTGTYRQRSHLGSVRRHCMLVPGAQDSC